MAAGVDLAVDVDQVVVAEGVQIGIETAHPVDLPAKAALKVPAVDLSDREVFAVGPIGRMDGDGVYFALQLCHGRPPVIGARAP